MSLSRHPSSPPDFHRLIRRLAGHFPGPLPGLPAQLRMAPEPRPGWSPGEFPPDCRDGAALLLLSPEAAGPAVILTVRTENVLHHRGQVSLPGGAVEKGEDLIQAALRETHEEIGLDPVLVRILGPLTPLHIPVSGFVLHPFVGAVEKSPVFQEDPREVARLLRVSLADLADPRLRKEELRTIGGLDYRVPFFAVEGEQVWGATAMVLAEFLELVSFHDEAPEEEGMS